jgi:hypothetical protein
VLLDRDGNNNELCICRFENEYEKTLRLSGYFSKPEINEYHSVMFQTFLEFYKQIFTIY